MKPGWKTVRFFFLATTLCAVPAFGLPLVGSTSVPLNLIICGVWGLGVGALLTATERYWMSREQPANPVGHAPARRRAKSNG